MKLLFLFILLAAPVLAAEPVLTAGGTTYRNATVQRVTPYLARITHDAGAANVPAWDLDRTQQVRFGFEPSLVAIEHARVEAAKRAEAEHAQRLALTARAAEELAQREARRRAELLAGDRAAAQERRLEPPPIPETDPKDWITYAAKLRAWQETMRHYLDLCSGAAQGLTERPEVPGVMPAKPGETKADEIRRGKDYTDRLATDPKWILDTVTRRWYANPADAARARERLVQGK